MRTPTWSTTAGTGGRSLRTVTVTRPTRGVLATGFGDARGEPLEELVALGLDDPDRARDHRAVVDGVGEVVRCAGRTQVHLELEVDAEGLRAGLLLGQHAVDAEDLQAR